MIYKVLIVISYFICLLIILISKFSKHKLRPIKNQKWKNKIKKPKQMKMIKNQLENEW